MTKFQRTGSERAKLTGIIKESQEVCYRKAQTHYKFVSPFLFDTMYLTEWVIKREGEAEKTEPGAAQMHYSLLFEE